MAVLREVAIGALQSLFSMDVHQMHSLARIDAGFDEFPFTGLAPFLGIIRGDDTARCIEQIAFAVALQNCPEIPAMAVVIGELRVLELAVEIIDIAQKIELGPFALWRRAFGIALQHVMGFLGGRVLLLLRPHLGRVGFIVPHGVTKVAVQEDIGLVHVTIHALGGWDCPGKDMLERMPALLDHFGPGSGGLGIMLIAHQRPVCRYHLVGDCRILGDRLPVAAERGVNQAVTRFAVIGIDHVATSAARMAIIARLIVGAHEPHVGIVEPRLVDIEHRDCHPEAGTGAAIGLLEVGPSGLFHALAVAAGVGQADFGKLGADRAPAPLKHAENVARRDHLPAGQGVKLGECPARLLAFGQLARDDTG